MTVEAVENISTTPAGIEVRFQQAPKRAYWVRWAENIPPVEADPIYNPGVMVDVGPRPYMGMNDWIEVPSVTTVLDVLDKPGLTWWGMKVGVQSVCHLYDVGFLREYDDEPSPWWKVPDRVVDLVRKHKLTVNDTRDKAGDRGTSVHALLEFWAETGILPNLLLFEGSDEYGYVVALRKFLEHVEPEPVDHEIMVGSIQHGFAGRYDIRFRVTKEVPVIVHYTPVKGPQWALLPAGLYLADLKTSKDVYPKHAKQLEAYELASVECGYEPTDYRGILQVDASGLYKFVRSWATGDDFLTTLAEYNSQEAMKKRRKAITRGGK